MKLIFAIVALAMLVAQPAAAQTTTFYSPTGGYQGQAVRSGNTTTYYGPTGGYQGSSATLGNTTMFYGPTGGYQGQTMRNPPAFRPFVGSRGGFGGF
jgi:hypothetical protein